MQYIPPSEGNITKYVAHLLGHYICMPFKEEMLRRNTIYPFTLLSHSAVRIFKLDDIPGIRLAESLPIPAHSDPSLPPY